MIKYITLEYVNTLSNIEYANKNYPNVWLK